jgi:hypothetical protein
LAFYGGQLGCRINAVILLQIGDLAFNISGRFLQPLVLFARPLVLH